MNDLSSLWRKEAEARSEALVQSNLEIAWLRSEERRLTAENEALRAVIAQVHGGIIEGSAADVDAWEAKRAALSARQEGET